MLEPSTKWNEFVAKNGPQSGAFLQSYEWGEFQRSVGREICRFVLTESGLSQMNANINTNEREWLGVMQVIKMPLPLGKSYLYVPRGPITISNFQFSIFNFKKELEKLAKKEGAIFVKIELPIEEQDFNQINLQPTRFADPASPKGYAEARAPARSDESETRRARRATYNLQPKSIQPQNTLILDLSKSEEELLGAMHEKTRYNIRLAERKGVQVRWATAETLESDLEKFWRLAQKTSKRDGFSYHSKEYYRKMFKIIEAKPRYEVSPLSIKLVLTEKDGETLAANIVVFFGDTVTYLHGASNYKHRKLMAPHLLQWRTIQEAKQLGYKNYDFWGIAPPKADKFQVSSFKFQEKHSWAGITRFKMGFGGEVISYAPTLDLIVNKFWYKLYRLGKLLLKS